MPDLLKNSWVSGLHIVRLFESSSSAASILQQPSCKARRLSDNLRPLANISSRFAVDLEERPGSFVGRDWSVTQQLASRGLSIVSLRTELYSYGLEVLWSALMTWEGQIQQHRPHEYRTFMQALNIGMRISIPNHQTFLQLPNDGRISFHHVAMGVLSVLDSGEVDAELLEFMRKEISKILCDGAGLLLADLQLDDTSDLSQYLKKVQEAHGHYTEAVDRFLKEVSAAYYDVMLRNATAGHPYSLQGTNTVEKVEENLHLFELYLDKHKHQFRETEHLVSIGRTLLSADIQKRRKSKEGLEAERYEEMPQSGQPHAEQAELAQAAAVSEDADGAVRAGESKEAEHLDAGTADWLDNLDEEEESHVAKCFSKRSTDKANLESLARVRLKDLGITKRKGQLLGIS